ncbi:hypothetical protein ACOSQ2_003037 [Xanthoceras sorbifolium]
MEIDRLSNLPDTVIFHEVVSRLDTNKEAVKTCVLSKDWTHHWYHVHTLCLDYRSFKTRTAFKGFVLHVLQHRQTLSISLSSGSSGEPIETGI